MNEYPLPTVYDEIETQPLGVHKVSYDRIQKLENRVDTTALYMRYCSLAFWRRKNYIWATTEYMSKLLNISKLRIRKAKKDLIELGLVEDHVRKENNIIIGHYIKVNYISVHEKSHPTKIAQCGDLVGNIKYNNNNLKTNSNTEEEINISAGVKRQRKIKVPINEQLLLSENEQLKEKIKQLENQLKPIQSELFEKGQLITPSQFEMFWELYPSNASKGAALSAWLKLCNQKNKQSIRPTWKVVKTALEMQIKSELWTKEPQYIPYPSTWLNNNGWLNDASEMKVFKKDVKVKPIEKRSFGFVGKPIKYNEPIEM